MIRYKPERLPIAVRFFNGFVQVEPEKGAHGKGAPRSRISKGLTSIFTMKLKRWMGV